MFRLLLLPFATTLALALTPLVVLAAPMPPETKETAPAEKIRKQLDQNITLEITEQPLTLALNQIREQTKINFVLDRAMIQQLGLVPEQMPVSAKLKDAKTRSCLRAVLAPYNLGFAIIGDTVLISTDDMAMQRQMRQRVSLDLDKVDLGTALRRLSKETAANVMLDTRLTGKEGKIQVSLQLDDVPLDTAIQLVAEVGGLKPVQVGNVLIVTTKALAAQMRTDPELMQPPQTPQQEMQMMQQRNQQRIWMMQQGGGAVMPFIQPVNPPPAGGPAPPVEKLEKDIEAPNR